MSASTFTIFSRSAAKEDATAANLSKFSQISAPKGTAVLEADQKANNDKAYLNIVSRRHSIGEMNIPGLDGGGGGKGNDNFMDALRQYYHPEDHEPHEIDSDDSEEDFYSDKAILKRESLRFDPKVIESLTNIWNVVDENHDNSVDFGEYFAMFKRLIIILRGREHKFEVTEVASLAAKEFSVDAFGQETIDKPRFFQTFFQIADHWTHQICAEEYKMILDDLLGCMTGVKDGAIVFRDVDNTYTLEEYRALAPDHPDRNRDLRPKSTKKDEERPRTGSFSGRKKTPPSAPGSSRRKTRRTQSGDAAAEEIPEATQPSEESQKPDTPPIPKPRKKKPVETALFERAKSPDRPRSRGIREVKEPEKKPPREYKQPEKKPNSAKRVKKRVVTKKTPKKSNFSGGETLVLQQTHIREGMPSTFHWTAGGKDGASAIGAGRQKVWREKPKDWAEKMKSMGCKIETNNDDGASSNSSNQIDDHPGSRHLQSAPVDKNAFSRDSGGVASTMGFTTKSIPMSSSEMMRAFLNHELDVLEPAGETSKSGAYNFESTKRHIAGLQQHIDSQQRALQKNRSRGLLPGLIFAKSKLPMRTGIQEPLSTTSTEFASELDLLSTMHISDDIATHDNVHWSPFGCQEDFLQHKLNMIYSLRLQSKLEEGLHGYSPVVRERQKGALSRAHTASISEGSLARTAPAFNRSVFFGGEGVPSTAGALPLNRELPQLKINSPAKDRSIKGSKSLQHL